jgi:hypothetical protein
MKIFELASVVSNRDVEAVMKIFELPWSHIDRRILYDTAEAFAKTNIGSQFL